MPSEIDTEKIEKIVQRSIDVHQARCPSIKAVGDAIRQMNQDQQKRHETTMEKYSETEKQMLKGDFQFKDHDRRLNEVEESAEVNADEISGLKEAVAQSKVENAEKEASLLWVVIKYLIIVIGSSSGGAAAIKALEAVI